MAETVERHTKQGTISYRPTDDYTVTGRGRIVCITPPKGGEHIHVGDTIRIDGTDHRVTDIEISRGLTDPPVTLGCGLVVTPIKSLDDPQPLALQ